MSGFFRFVSVGKDTYLVGAAFLTSLNTYGDSDESEGLSYYYFPITKISKTADGALSWKFVSAFGTSVDDTTAVFRNGVLWGETKWVYRDVVKAHYKWISEPLVGKGYPGNEEGSSIYGALSSFSDQAFADQLRGLPTAPTMMLQLPKKDFQAWVPPVLVPFQIK